MLIKTMPVEKICNINPKTHQFSPKLMHKFNVTTLLFQQRERGLNKQFFFKSGRKLYKHRQPEKNNYGKALSASISFENYSN